MVGEAPGRAVLGEGAKGARGQATQGGGCDLEGDVEGIGASALEMGEQFLCSITELCGDVTGRVDRESGAVSHVADWLQSGRYRWRSAARTSRTRPGLRY